MKAGQKLTRTFALDRRELSEEDRTVEVAFSSEEPVERNFGFEILDHSPSSVRLSRLNNGAAVLVDHDSRDHVGVVEKSRIDADKRGRAVLRFGRSQRAQEVFQDVVDGIRKQISVGYVVHKFDRSKRNDSDEYRATDWEPFEVSIVAIPADASVGVGRSLPSSDEEIPMSKETPAQERQDKPTAPAIDVKAEREKSIKAERERISTIQRLGDEHGFSELAREFIDNGKSDADFRSAVLTEIGKRNNEIRANGTETDEVGLSERDKGRYSLTRAMAAVAAETLNPQQAQKYREAAGFEIEVGEAAAQKLGIEARGIFIPSEVVFAQRDLSVGTNTAGGHLVATNLLAGSFIDVLRNQSALGSAGATILDGLIGDVAIPRKTSASTATWISAEDGDATESEPAFDQVTLTPKDLAVYTEVTRRLLQQSTPSIDAIVRDDIVRSVRLAADLAGLYGSGVAGQPTGVAGTSGINSVTFAGTQPTWAELVQMITEVKIDNADMGSTRFITDANGWDAGMTTEKATNTGLFVINENSQTIAGRGLTVSNQVDVGDWFFGVWSDLLIGLWGGMELNVDPYTHSLKGKLRYVVFNTLDLAVRHAESFVRGNSGSTA